MGGSELAGRLRATRPGLRVLYMSGYAKDMNVPRGADGPGPTFLQKPFTPQDLAGKVREALSV